jgi:hypothetical protein
MREKAASYRGFFLSVESKGFRRKRRVTFCLTAKSHQKTFLFLAEGAVRDRTSPIRARTARFLRAITVVPD